MAEPKSSRTAAAAAPDDPCSCGHVFRDEWERVKHRVIGDHRYRSWTGEVSRRREVVADAARIPSARVDLRKQCHRCLKHADDDDLFLLAARWYHREACTP